MHWSLFTNYLPTHSLSVLLGQLLVMINGQTCSLTQWMHLIRFKQKQEDTWFPFLSLPTPWYPCPLPVILCSLTIFTAYSLCYPSPLPLLSLTPSAISIHSPSYPCPLFLLSLLTMSLIPVYSVIPSHSLCYPAHTLWFFKRMSLSLPVDPVHSQWSSSQWSYFTLLTTGCSTVFVKPLFKKKNHLNTRNWTGGTWGLSVLYL